MSSSAIELDSRMPAPAPTVIEESQQTNDRDGNDTHTGTLHEFSLPPTDTGKDAWLFLAACWAVEALVWGTCPRPFCSCYL
jgi:hypothetical protein